MAKERIDKIISSQTTYSRRDVTILIKKKRVLVNNVLCKSGSEKIDPGKDIITIDGKDINYKKNIYLMVNKPKGVVSATIDKHDRTIIDIVYEEFKRDNLFPCGRLDKDTTGLIIITDDGEFSHNIMSPKKDVYKTYIAKVDKIINENIKEKFENNLVLKDGYVCKKAFFEKIGDDLAKIRICEGKFHQVKKMCSACGYEVIELKRTAIGDLTLDKNLNLGEMRELTQEEMGLLIDK